MPSAGSSSSKRRVGRDEVDVTLPTPPHLWFTLENGWPEKGWSDLRIGKRTLADLRRIGVVTENPPSNICPTVQEAPSRRPLKAEVIGEIFVEILEARGLPSHDLIGSTDAFAILVFEGVAGRTCTVNNTAAPRWHAGSSRAFRLPILHPSSNVYIGLFDDDGSVGVADDDPVGRVVLSLGGLHPRTSYDSWLPLQCETHAYHAGRRYGMIRVRHRVEWTNHRTALLRTLKEQPRFVIPFTKERYLVAARFAVEGSDPESSYSWGTLMAEINEAMRMTKKLTAAAKELALDENMRLNAIRTAFVIFALVAEGQGPLWRLVEWHYPVLSVALLISWQLLCVWPQFVPPFIAFLLLGALLQAYLNSPSANVEDVPAVMRRLSIGDFLRALLLPKALGGGELPPLGARRATQEEAAGHRGSAFSKAGSARSRAGSVSSSGGGGGGWTGGERAGGERAGSGPARYAVGDEALDDCETDDEEEEAPDKDPLEIAEAEIEEELEAEFEAAREARRREIEMRGVSDTVHSWVAARRRWRLSANPLRLLLRGCRFTILKADHFRRKVDSGIGSLNPIAKHLKPAQELLHIGLSAARSARSILVLSSWVFFSLLLVGCGTLLLVPFYPLIQRVLAHLAGIGLLGPQWWHWRLQREKRQAEHAKLLERFNAGGASRQQVIAEVRARQSVRFERMAASEMELAEKSLEEEDSAFRQREKMQRRLRRDCRFCHTHVGTMTPRGRFGETRPDPRLASATPLAESAYRDVQFEELSAFKGFQALVPEGSGSDARLLHELERTTATLNEATRQRRLHSLPSETSALRAFLHLPLRIPNRAGGLVKRAVTTRDNRA